MCVCQVTNQISSVSGISEVVPQSCSVPGLPRRCAQNSHDATLPRAVLHCSAPSQMASQKTHGSWLCNSLSWAVCHVKLRLVLIHLAPIGRDDGGNDVVVTGSVGVELVDPRLSEYLNT